MGDPLSSSALVESIQLLAEDNTDYTDYFGIDSDDEDIFPSKKNDQEGAASTSQKSAVSPPPSLGHPNLSSDNDTHVSSSPVTPVMNSGVGNVSTLKKKTVSVTEDPLSGTSSWHPTPQPHAQPQPQKVQEPITNENTNSNLHIKHTGSYSAGAPVMTEASSVANLVSTKTAQSLSSTFSSFASKFQDAVNSVGAVTVTTAAAGTTGNIPVQQPISNASMSTNYVNRSTVGVAAAPHTTNGMSRTPVNINAQRSVGFLQNNSMGGVKGSGPGNATIYSSNNVNSPNISTAADPKHLDNAKKS